MKARGQFSLLLDIFRNTKKHYQEIVQTVIFSPVHNSCVHRGNNFVTYTATRFYPTLSFKLSCLFINVHNANPKHQNDRFLSFTYFYGNQLSWFIERFSLEYRKTKTIEIILANHNRHRQSNEPIITRSKYLSKAPSAGIRVQACRDDWF